MKRIIMLLAVFLVPITCWLLGIFISGEVNAMLWGAEDRFLLVAFSLLATAITELFIWENF